MHNLIASNIYECSCMTNTNHQGCDLIGCILCTNLQAPLLIAPAGSCGTGCTNNCQHIIREVACQVDMLQGMQLVKMHLDSSSCCDSFCYELHRACALQAANACFLHAPRIWHCLPPDMSANNTISAAALESVTATPMATPMKPMAAKGSRMMSSCHQRAPARKHRELSARLSTHLCTIMATATVTTPAFVSCTHPPTACGQGRHSNLTSSQVGFRALHR